MIGHHRGRPGRHLGESAVGYHLAARSPAVPSMWRTPAVRTRRSNSYLSISNGPSVPVPTTPAAHRGRPGPWPSRLDIGSSGFSHSTGTPSWARSPGSASGPPSRYRKPAAGPDPGRPVVHRHRRKHTNLGRPVHHRDPRQRASPLPGRAPRPPYHLADPRILPGALDGGPFPVPLHPGHPRVGQKSRTACPAPSSASVLAGGAPRSTRMTTGSAYCGPHP